MKYDFGASFFFSFFILLYGLTLFRPAPKAPRNEDIRRASLSLAELSWNTAVQPKR